MENKDRIFAAVFATMLYACLYAVLNAARGAHPEATLLLFVSSAAPLFVVFALFRLIMSAATAALLASLGVFLLHRRTLLGNAEAAGFDFRLGDEAIFAAGRLTEAGAQRLLTEYALQGAALLAAALLANGAVGLFRARTAS